MMGGEKKNRKCQKKKIRVDNLSSKYVKLVVKMKDEDI